MFGLGHYRMVAGHALPLRTLHIRETHLSGQIRIFAEILLNSPPARITAKVEDRSEDHVDAGRARLGRDNRASLLRNLEIPGCSEADRSRKHRTVVEAVQPFFDE